MAKRALEVIKGHAPVKEINSHFPCIGWSTLPQRLGAMRANTIPSDASTLQVMRLSALTFVRTSKLIAAQWAETDRGRACRCGGGVFAGAGRFPALCLPLCQQRGASRLRDRGFLIKVPPSWRELHANWASSFRAPVVAREAWAQRLGLDEERRWEEIELACSAGVVELGVLELVRDTYSWPGGD
jgi:hypothetical protein